VKAGDLIFDPVDAGDSSVESLAFDPADDTLAVLLGDGTLKRYALADLSSGTQDLGSTRSTHPTVGIASAALGPDGRAWAIGLDGGNIVLGRTGEPATANAETTAAALVEQACRIASRNLSEFEWSRFIHDEPYAATCPAAPAEASQG
jgi:hypothetical protein